MLINRFLVDVRCLNALLSESGELNPCTSLPSAVQGISSVAWFVQELDFIVDDIVTASVGPIGDGIPHHGDLIVFDLNFHRRVHSLRDLVGSDG